jgi:parallel beta-helix repeat protein
VSDNVQAPPTYIAGTVYDGSGGPWTTANSPYIVVENVTVPQGELLTIEPGVVVKFDGFYNIFVEGTLNATGTSSNRITFTSNKSNPSTLDWEGIQIYIAGKAYLGFSDISYSGLGVRAIYSSNNIIFNNTFSNNYVSGIYLTSSSHNIIIDNEISNNRDGIRVSSSSLNNTIEDNDIHSNTLAGIRIYASILGFPMNNTVRNNSVFLNGQYGISLVEALNNTVLDNDIYSNADTGIRIENGVNNIVMNNSVFSNTFRGIRTSGTNNSIVGNNVSSNFLEGIWITGKDIVMNNTIKNHINGLEIGSWYAKFANNSISNNEYGIYLQGGPFFDNPNDIFENNISFNDYGIYIYHGSGNSIRNNTIFSNNICGIAVPPVPFPGRNNRIFHNSFINNPLHAFDDTGLNFWNESYPSGGNYWDNWTSPDSMKGKNQNIPGGDGIVDNPHPFDGYNLDHYPLTAPHTPGPPPLPPTNLSAELTGPKNENITLTWNLSGDDSAGDDDILGYAIFYDANYSPERQGYRFLDFVMEGNDSYMHLNAGEGDPNNHFYHVEAWTTDRASNGTENQVAKFTRNLTIGNHIASIPLVQSNESVEAVLRTLKYGIAWHYNSSDPLGHWKSYHPAKSYPQSLDMINHIMGLWMNVTTKSNLTIAGVVPLTTTIFLKEGWNFVSYPSFIERTAADALSGIMYDRIEGYNETSPQNLEILTDSSILKPGYGYWIKVQSDQVWIVENQS